MNQEDGKDFLAPQSGEQRTVVRKYGKHVFFQDFTMPGAAESSEFLLFELSTIPSIVFPVTCDGKVIAIRQFRHGANQFVLELPGGCPLVPGADAAETFRRELAEETGYSPTSFLQLVGSPLWFEPAASRMQYDAFLALDCIKTQEPKPDSNEVLRVELYELSIWAMMLTNGSICDDKTIAVSLLALSALGWRLTPPAR